MRWDKLFDDLETQLEHELTAEELDLEAEEERLRLGRLSIRDRLILLHEAQHSQERYTVSVTLRTGRRLVLHPVAFGRDWISAEIVDESARRDQCIVPLAAVATFTFSAAQLAASLRPSAGKEPAALAARLGIPFVLRDLCRRRSPVDLVLDNGDYHGTIDRVGRDQIDLAVHERGSARRESAVTEYRVVALHSLLFVRL